MSVSAGAVGAQFQHFCGSNSGSWQVDSCCHTAGNVPSLVDKDPCNKCMCHAASRISWREEEEEEVL